MASDNENQASPMQPPQPFLNDRIASLNRTRFRRIKSPPMASSNSFPLESTTSTSIPPPRRPRSLSYYLNPSYKKAAIILPVYLGVGTLCFYLVRHQIDGRKTNEVLDALYFTVITLTSVGYGDLSPGSDLAKLLASLFVIFGMLLVGLVLGKAADYLVKKQEIVLKKALHMNQTNTNVETLKEMKTNQVRNKCIILVALFVVLVVGGMAVLLFVEDLEFVLAFYCVVATITSLGYTDKCFSTKGGRVFALFWILSGTVYLGQLLYTIVVLYTERRRWAIMKWILTKTTPKDLEAADLDDDGVVVAAEFVLYKLKEMGKISQEDMMPIMEEFERLDFDKTGTLTTSDVLLSQSSWYAEDNLLT